METGKGGASVEVQIAPANMQYAKFHIRGTAPYVQHKFSAKARAKMRQDMEEGQKGKGGKRRPPKDFKAEYEDALYKTKDGWHGIPAAAFRAAMISACRLANFQMTRAKLTVFIEADGYDLDESRALVRITKGKPHPFETYTRLATGVPTIAVRPMWDAGWEAEVVVRYDADMLKTQDIANLLVRAGMQVGVGEGRPDSKDSAGMEWGLFEVQQRKEENDEK